MKFHLVILAVTVACSNAQSRPSASREETVSHSDPIPSSCQTVRADTVLLRQNGYTRTPNRCGFSEAFTTNSVKLTADVKIQPFRVLIYPGPTFEYIEILFRNVHSESYNSLRVYNDHTYPTADFNGKLYSTFPFVEDAVNILNVNFTELPTLDNKVELEMTPFRRTEPNDTQKHHLIVSDKGSTRIHPIACSSQEGIPNADSSQMHLRLKGEVTLRVFLENQCSNASGPVRNVSKQFFSDPVPDARPREKKNLEN